MIFKSLLIFFIFIIGLSISFLQSSQSKNEDPLSLYTIINMENYEMLPRNFRMTQQPHSFMREKNPSFHGLPELQASASGQFSQKGLAKILEVVPAAKILLIDLRKESHGFVNGIAISWHDEKNWRNKDKVLEEIIIEEKQLLEKALENKYIKLYQKNVALESPQWIHVKDAYSEAELAHRMGIQYKRIPVTDHLKPTDYDVDHFVDLIKAHGLHKNTSDMWIHLHCSAGRGRSTTFISMYDMMRNALHVSFDDILSRQEIIGGKDLSEPFDTSDWRYEYHFERLNFLINFYNYCLENPNFEKSWSSWIKKHI